MSNYDCVKALINSNTFDIKGIVDYYVSYVSVFYCKDFKIDETLTSKINDLQDYINKQMNGDE